VETVLETPFLETIAATLALILAERSRSHLLAFTLRLISVCDTEYCVAIYRVENTPARYAIAGWPRCESQQAFNGCSTGVCAGLGIRRTVVVHLACA
jgi:hypothetical protein